METIYREHFGFVWSLLRRLGVAAADVEDVAQDVFVVVHRRLPEFEGHAAVRTWLYAITTRVAFNHLRRCRTRALFDDGARAAAVAPTVATDPEEHAARRGAQRLLDGLLERLDPKKRAVFVLADIEGLAASEIADIVGSNTRTVYSRLRAARGEVQTDLARLRAQANGRRRWLQRAAQSQPEPRARARVWAALTLTFSELSPATPLAQAGAAAGTKAATVAAAVSVAGLAVLLVGSAASGGRSLPQGRAAVASSASPGTAGPSPASIADVAGRGVPVSAVQVDADLGVGEDPRVVADPPGRRTTSKTRGIGRPRKRTSEVSLARDDVVPVADALLVELSLVERARTQINQGRAVQALRTLDEHARRFAHGAFVRERERERDRARRIVDGATGP